MNENSTRTVVTVHQLGAVVGDNGLEPMPTVRYDADSFEWDHDGDLGITRGGAVIAVWARGTWQRAEVTEEEPSIQDECSAPAGEFVPNEEMADTIARRYYDAIDPYEDSRARGPESLANKLYAAALDGLRA